jgi:hypothetical protein
MPSDYLHNHPEFPALLRILEGETDILAGLIEKDYWIMHVLFGLKKQEFDFELKGGTSLSKGYKIIERFSEDIDIHIKPPPDMQVVEDPRKDKPSHIETRKKYYDWLASEIKIDGIVSVERDHPFDNETFTSGGVRLIYKTVVDPVPGVKEGTLLEAGFDNVTPNEKLTISSWAYDKASTTEGISIIDNRAIDIICYHPGYTFVEKLQTIATKFRQEQTDGKERANYMRQYYDVYSLLANDLVLKFIGTEEYEAHKKRRFPKKDLETPIAENEAFKLSDPKLRDAFKKRYVSTKALYYTGQPDFDEVMKRIGDFLNKL